MDLSCREHVENLEQYEHVKDNCQVSRVGALGEGFVDFLAIKTFEHTTVDHASIKVKVIRVIVN